MNPNQDPILLAAQQQQASQPDQSSPQPQQPTPSPVDLAQQQIQQYSQVDQANEAAMKQKQNAVSEASKAMATLNPQANSKDATSNTMSKVGSALNTNNYSGLCLQYVDDQTGNKARQPTAIADYQANEQDGNIKTSGTPPKGSRVYFAPTSDNPAGHIGLSNGDGTFTGATTNDGIKTFNIKNWESYAGQQYIGYAPPNSK